DDERVVQRVVGEQEVCGCVERVGRRHGDAHRLRGTGWLDALDEAHRAPAAYGVIGVPLPGQPERLDAVREPDVDDVRVAAVVDGASLGEAGSPPRGGTG